MGYDEFKTTLAIPLIYVYTNIKDDIYHVKDSDIDG
jgi:hypothetical protein